MQKYLSETITEEEINKWKNGDNIIIDAGTGVGKSYFCKTVLYEVAKKEDKKILFLVHRTRCKEQFIAELEKCKHNDYIDVMTYQSLEYRENNNLYTLPIEWNKYKYIICDEYHYFLTDSSMNPNTYVGFKEISDKNDCIKLFMSATGDDMKEEVRNVTKNNIYEYIIPRDWSWIKTLTFYNKDSSLENFAKECIQKNEKAIFFIQSATKAYDIYKKFKKNSLFLCGNSDKHTKYVDKNKISEMLINEKFNESILITTTCIDAGVNFIDYELKHIVCDVEDSDCLIQCLGRKRIQSDEDKVHIYIHNITNKQIGGKYVQLKKKVDIVTEYLKNEQSILWLQTQYGNQVTSDMFYEEPYFINNEEQKGKCVKKVNMFRFKKKFSTLLQYKFMKENKYGFCKYYATKFGFVDEGRTYRLLDENCFDINEYLQMCVDEKLMFLQVKDRKELIEKMNITDGRGRQLKSLEALNASLAENNSQYRIIQFRKQIDGREYKAIWNVIKNEI